MVQFMHLSRLLLILRYIYNQLPLYFCLSYSCQIKSRGKASLLCLFSDDLFAQLFKIIFYSQISGKASLLYVYLGVFLSGTFERNSFHSQSKSKASRLCVFSDEPLAQLML
jgi:hypothetical protein